MLWLASKSVYVGDLRCLLQALDVLRDEVEFTPDKLLCSVFPMSHAVYDYMRGVTLARANASYSSRELISIVANQPEDPEPTFEYNIFMRELLNHMRDTPDHPEVLAALLAAAGIRNTPQTWISVLACLLRSAGTLNPRITNNYLDRARRALGDRRRRYSKRDIGAFSLGVAAVRTEIYEHYLGHPTRFDRDENPSWERIHHAPSEAFGDLGTTGELMEVFAFFTLREGNFELASRYFDYAADRYYLQGLWQAGARVEWASHNVEQLQAAANAGSLAIRLGEHVRRAPSLIWARTSVSGS